MPLRLIIKYGIKEIIMLNKKQLKSFDISVNELDKVVGSMESRARERRDIDKEEWMEISNTLKGLVSRLSNMYVLVSKTNKI